ncbi:uncharacterized protein LOC130258491 [Oenanthe melanoleuca]|uniref:uncharacterized protein LOC130258491 n=1 Tax=Oenanthe melanoleuca TaxID=2939378 RepID=UPI0024C14061|nr:uncharacterized protein LOC130258491 [Oenanthe melanoleuca]
MWQMLKEMLQRKQGMKGEAVQKQDAFPGGNSGSVPASAAGREAMPGTVTGGDVPRKIPPLSWLHRDLKPLEPPAGVSAGRISLTPVLDAAHKLSSHHRVALKGNIRDTGDKNSMETSEVIQQMLKEMQQGGQGMKGEAVQKQDAFPRGNSGSVPASAAGRQAVPGTVTGDVVPGKVSPFAWLHKDLEHLESPAGVSAGNTFPAPLLIATQKPSSHHRGTQRGKNKDMAEKESLESNDILKQTMKELQKRHEMDMEVLWKAAFPHGSSRSLAAPASRGKAMPGTGTGTGTGDGIAGKVSPLAWWYEVLKPLEPPAGVPAGRISPTPVLDAAHKPSSHPRGPPTEKTKHTTDKKFLKPFEVMRQMLKEMLQERQEVDGEDVLKAAFPGGSSVSIAGKEPMPGTVTGDWDRDLDYLEALVEYGMKFLKDAEDEPIGEGDLAIQPTFREEPLGAGEGVPAGRISLPPGLDAAHKPDSHLRGKTQETGAKNSVDSEEFLRQTQDKVQGGPVVKQKSVQKGAHPNGSSGSVPASPAGGTVTPGTGTGTGTGDGIAGKVSPLAWWYEVLKPLEPPAGVPAGRISPTPVLDAAHKPSSHPRGPPTEKTKHTTDKKFLKPFEVMRQMLKEMLQERQEVDGEDVLKAAFPGGSSVSIAGKEPMPGTVTGDWDRDLDYLEALVEYGMKFLKDAEDEPIGEGDLAFHPTFRTEPLGAGEGVPAGRISLPPGLDAAHKPDSHLRGKTQETGAKNSVDSEEFLRQTQDKVQGGPVVKQKSVQKGAHPNGSSGSVPASPAGGTVTPGTGTGTGTGDSAGTSTCVPGSQAGITNGFLQDKLTWLGLISGLLVLEFFCVVTCITIWNCWKRKCHTSGQQMKDGGNTSHSDSFSISNKSLGSPCKSSEKRNPKQPSPRTPPITL